MSCYRPLRGFVDPISKKARVGVGASGAWSLEVPCGRCVGCKIDRARAWSIRIGHEAQMWDSNWFVTLDYAPEFLEGPSLIYGHFQEFMRNLRRGLPKPLRFFVAGEYGPKYLRPHWHAILFNARLKDAREFQNETFRSEMVESAWGRGNCVLGGVTARSAAYVAGYTQSKTYGWEASEKYESGVDFSTGEVLLKEREFCRMSLKPGIGARWYEKFSEDLWAADIAVQDGKTFKPPRYYLEKLKLADPNRAARICYDRYVRSTEGVDPEEFTSERREVREKVAEARVKLFGERMG